MPFNTFDFLLFFTVVTAVYFRVPGRARWAWLLLASAFFFAVISLYFFLLACVAALASFTAAIAMERCGGKARAGALAAGILSILSLFVFVRWAGGGSPLSAWPSTAPPWNYSPVYLKFLLPLGFSFYSLRCISYLFEVYRGRPAEKHPGFHALSVLFYPAALVGPIDLPKNFSQSLREPAGFDYARLCAGLQLMVWGLFKKTVIADRLALFTQKLFGGAPSLDGPLLMLGLACFSLQIFCDISGYMDIGAGAARTMGFDARGGSWSVWSASIAEWFRRHVREPLEAVYPGGAFSAGAVLAGAAAMGLWYGPGWPLILWGLLYATMLILPLGRFLRFVWTSFLWIFFLAKDVPEAIRTAARLFENIGEFADPLFWSQRLVDMSVTGLGKRHWFLVIFFAAVMELVHRNQRRSGIEGYVGAGAPRYQRWALHIFFIMSILFFGVLRRHIPNI